MKIIFLTLCICFLVPSAIAGGKTGVPTTLKEVVIIEPPPPLPEEEEVCEWFKVPMESISPIPTVGYPVLLPIGCDSVMIPIGGGVATGTFSSSYRLSKICRKKGGNHD